MPCEADSQPLTRGCVCVCARTCVCVHARVWPVRTPMLQCTPTTLPYPSFPACSGPQGGSQVDTGASRAFRRHVPSPAKSQSKSEIIKALCGRLIPKLSFQVLRLASCCLQLALPPRRAMMLTNCNWLGLVFFFFFPNKCPGDRAVGTG